MQKPRFLKKDILSPDIHVITYFRMGEYITSIKHPEYNSGKPVSFDRHGPDENKATNRHQEILNFFLREYEREIMKKDGGLLIARYNPKNGVVVETLWDSSESQYITTVVHPTIADGQPIKVQVYGKDFYKAQGNHHRWVTFVDNKDIQQNKIEMPVKKEAKVIYPTKMKISLHTMIKILYHCIGAGNLTMHSERERPYELQVSMAHGKYSGSCMYDFNELEAWNISPRWVMLFEEARVKILDKQTKNNEKGQSPCDSKTNGWKST
jgi:hypothetical protein